jgi:hypothetical protein
MCSLLHISSSNAVWTQYTCTFTNVQQKKKRLCFDLLFPTIFFIKCKKRGPWYKPKQDGSTRYKEISRREEKLKRQNTSCPLTHIKWKQCQKKKKEEEERLFQSFSVYSLGNVLCFRRT